MSLKRERSKFIDKKNQEINKLDQEIEQWSKNLKLVELLKCKETDIVDLDVGGTQKISTTRSTLLKVGLFLHSITILHYQLCFQADMNCHYIMEEYSLIGMEILFLIWSITLVHFN